MSASSQRSKITNNDIDKQIVKERMIRQVIEEQLKFDPELDFDNKWS